MRTGYVDETWARSITSIGTTKSSSGSDAHEAPRWKLCAAGGWMRRRIVQGQGRRKRNDEDDPCSACGHVRGRVIRGGGGEAAAGAPLTDAQKAEAKAKADAAADLAKQQQAKAEDRVAAKYFANMKAQGKTVPAPQMAAAPAHRLSRRKRRCPRRNKRCLVAKELNGGLAPLFFSADIDGAPSARCRERVLNGLCQSRYNRRLAGEMAEWSKALDSKSSIRATVSRVRIPISPPFTSTSQAVFLQAAIARAPVDFALDAAQVPPAGASSRREFHPT